MAGHPSQRLTKARILLKADVGEAGEGWSDSRIIEALGTNMWMVCRVRKLVEEGFEAVLSRKQRAMPAVPKIFDGEKEAKLLACRTARSWPIPHPTPYPQPPHLSAFDRAASAEVA
jgi:hypothetical protein